MKNFGLIKDSYNTILSESIGSKRLNSKLLFKNYLKQIKENKVLRTQFLIYKNIEDMVEVNETKAIEYIRENISLMGKYTKQEILDANKLLESKIPTSLKEGSVYTNVKVKELHENISILILTKKTASSVGEIVEATLKVAEYINNNQVKVINEDLGVPTSLISNIAVEKFNEKYISLNETERKVINLIMDSSVENRSTFFNESVKGCLTQINEKLKESDSSVKESLLLAKENLLDRKFNDTTFISDISKILELNEDLK
jgi:hypothetical protein